MKKKKPDFIGELLWWSGETYKMYSDSEGCGAWEKIVFGSDVPPEDIPDVLNDYLRLADTLELSSEMRDAVFFKTAESLLRKAGIV